MKLIEWLFPKTESDKQADRLKTAVNKLRDKQRTNALARVAARLEALDQRGLPFAPQIGSAERSSTAVQRESYRLEYVYETSKTGYPFQPAVTATKVRFEQDPLFGWPGQAFPFDPFELWTEVAVNSFPRELYPDRPTTLRTQIAQDAIRLQSRIWFETCPQYSGPVGHLVNFVCGSGLTVDIVPNPTSKGTVYERDERNDKGLNGSELGEGDSEEADEESPEEAFAAEVQEWVDGFCCFRVNDCVGRCEQSALNILRDGEDALRVIPAPATEAGEEESYPILRTVDTSTIRGPHNEITGPWSFGVLTDWPRDWERPLAYHLWYSDNTHEHVAPEELHLTKLFTVGPNVKRGVPLAYKIRRQIPQAVKLLDCIAVGEAARQAIPYIRQFAMADQSAVRSATPSWLDQIDNDGDSDDEIRADIRPGEIPLINKNQEYVAPPATPGDGGASAMLTLDEKIAAALQVPLWFVKASTDEETKANALTAQSPVLMLIKRIQRKLCEHYRCIFEYAIKLDIAAGGLPADTLQRVCVHCELPSPESRDENEAIAADLDLMAAKLLSPQHVCARHNLDFEEEQDLLKKAEKAGWELPQVENNGQNVDNKKEPDTMAGKEPTNGDD